MSEDLSISLGAPSERRRAVAKGAMINSGFMVGLGALNLLKALIAASFVTRADFGIWSILILGLALVVGLKSVAVGDKYIQQDDEDQVLAFQRSFTLELLSSGLMMLACGLLAPLLVLIYGEPKLLVPSLALSLVLVGLAFQSPIWVFYRNLDFARQRIFLSVDPVVSFVVTIALAIAGLGYWSLVAGSIAGSLIGGLAAVLNCPYPLAWRYDHATMRSYLSFSGPLMIGVGSGLLIAQGAVIFGNAALGLAGAGAIGLAGIFASWTDRADAVVTEAMYPVICRVADRKELLVEAFAKSNRLALMWAVPFGLGLALFAGDLIHYVLGADWEGTAIVIQVVGINAAINHIGFNWGAFYRARGDTKPIAVQTIVAMVAFFVAPVPLMFIDGLNGFAIGMIIMTLVGLATRAYYVLKLFPHFPIAQHVARAVGPVLPAVALVLIARFVGEGTRDHLVVAGELVAYALVAIAFTLLFERHLLREARSYLVPVRPIQAEVPTA